MGCSGGFATTSGATLASFVLRAFFPEAFAAVFFAPLPGDPEVVSLIVASSRSARNLIALFRGQRSSHKTLPHMNPSRPLFPIVAGRIKPLVLVSGCLLLVSCVGNPFKDAAVDPASPVAADVARLTRGDAAFPGFEGIPKTPKDVRPLANYGRDAQAMLRAGAALERDTAPETWTLKGTDAFVEKAMRDAGPQIEPPKPGDAEAFARELRERATPPPPR